MRSATNVLIDVRVSLFRYINTYYEQQELCPTPINRWHVTKSACSEFKGLVNSFWVKGVLRELVLNLGSCLTLQCQLCLYGLNDYFLSQSFHNLTKDRELAVCLQWGDCHQALFCSVQTQASSFVSWSFARGHSSHNFRPQPLSWWSFLGNWTQWERFPPLLSLWVSIFLPL